MQAMRTIKPPLELEDEANEVHRSYIEGEATATDFDHPPVSVPKSLSARSITTCMRKDCQGAPELSCSRGQ